MRLAYFLTFCLLYVSVECSTKLESRPTKAKALLEKDSKPLLPVETSESEETESSEEFGIESWFPTSIEDGNSFRKLSNTFNRLWNRLIEQVRSTVGDETQTERRITETQNANSDEEEFAGGFFELFRPWWKGSNVCTREEETEESVEEGQSAHSMMMSTCRDAGDSYKCVMKLGKGRKVIVRTLVYECCYGYTRSQGERGCTQELNLQDTLKTLKDMNLTRFAEVIEITGLTVKFSEKNLTIFAPTNEALGALTDTDEIDFVEVNSGGDQLQYVRNIVLGHMLAGRQMSHQWNDEQVLASEADSSSVRITRYNQPRPSVFANCARLTDSNKQATDGVIHTVDRVLMPARQNLWDLLANDRRFTVFASLVSSSLQERLLAADNHLTVLAFTDEAFNKLDDVTQEMIRSKKDCFEDMLEEYVIPHTICSGAVYGDNVVKNLANHYINATKITEGDESLLEFHGVPVVSSDKMATNGVIHVLGGVILLDHMLSPIELAKRKKSHLAARLEEANALESLKAEHQPYTLFLPPNEDLFEKLNSLTAQEQIDLIQNHVVDNLVTVSSANPEAILTTMSGEELSLRVQRRPDMFNMRGFSVPVRATLGCARIVAANQMACGGVIHKVDQVLTKPSKNIMELLRESEDLLEFTTLLEVSGLSSQLEQGNFTGTIIAPTNTAFEEHLDAKLKEDLLVDQARLSNFLKTHILTDETCCHSLGTISFFHRNLHTTMTGSRLISRGYGNEKTVGGANIESCDQLASNGIIHKVSRPIMRRPRRVMSFGDWMDRMSDWS